MSEAASLAGHLGLGSIVMLYDQNEITIDGSTNLAFTEDLERFDLFSFDPEAEDLTELEEDDE